MDAAMMQGIAQLADTGLNMFWSGQLNKQQHDFSTEMYRIQRQDALADWNRQNAYNSPAAQMQRLQQAGLNPNLVYGRGADATSGPIRSSSPGSYNPTMPKLNLGDIMSRMYDVKLQKAQLDNVRAQNDAIKADTELKRINAVVQKAVGAKVVQDTAKSGVDTSTGEFNLSMAKQLQPITLEAAQADLTKKYADIRYTLDENERKAAMNAPNVEQAIQGVINLKKQGLKTDDERRLLQQQFSNAIRDGRIKEFENNLNEMGATKGDPLWFRGLAALIHDWLGSILKK